MNLTRKSFVNLIPLGAKLKHVRENLTLSQRFMLAALVILFFGMIGIGTWVERQIVTGVIHRTGATTALYVDSFIAPMLQDIEQTGELSAQDREALRGLFAETPMGQQIVTLRVWNPQGRLLFTTDSAVVGKSYAMHEGMLRARLGEVVSLLSPLEDDENKALGELYDQLMETYSPVRLSDNGQVIAVVEFYQRTDELDQEIGTLKRSSWLVVGLTILVVYLLLAGFVRSASNTITTQQEQLAGKVHQLTGLLAQNRELHARVQRASASVALLNEGYLKRTGAELHDGPAQDLGLSLLKLDALAGKIEKQPFSPLYHEWIEQINQVESSLQNALKEIRGIATGLSLPQLSELSLVETVTRVARAHERKTGTQVELELAADCEQAAQAIELPIKITVYRLVQEALNNAFRHAGGVEQHVRVTLENNQLLVEVSDKGPGFIPNQAGEWNGRLGQSGMRERVESLGGLFRIETQIGQGTTVIAYLPCQVGEQVL